MPDAPDLVELCRAAVEAAERDEAVEAYASESRHTEVRARGSEVEGLTFSETRGVGVRVISDGRLGYAYAADPSPDEVRHAVARARENVAFATADEFNVLPLPGSAEPLPSIFRDSQAALDTDRKVSLALDLERVATTSDPRVTKTDEVLYGDAVSRGVVVSTTGVSEDASRTDCLCMVSALAEGGDETQSGFDFRLAREIGDLDWADCASSAADRAARLLGATKPPTGRLPVALDPNAASSFLGVLAGALSAESVQKGRSLFAELVGEQIGAELFTLIDDGRLEIGPDAAPFDDEGVPSERTPLIERGQLKGFLHNSYTAKRGGTRSTGNAKRGSYRGPPGVGTSNFYVEEGAVDPSEILERAEGGVLIQDVSGVHSGANPISGEFSVGATGLRVQGGSLAEPLREMTIASTIPEMLKAVAAVGNDLRFFSSVGTPTLLIGEMTEAGV
ncbi:MAG: TldD/PmbA family protein [Actinomycetota bacterium]|nr:TldD/PmbA family protein [Actinomycetota bacterium]